MRTRITSVVALVLLLAACSGSSADTTLTTETTEASTTTTEATTTTTPETTTTVDDRPRSPLNGLPVDDPELLDRRAIAVKMDNHWNARPQSGVLEADAVFEIRVEGGLTRFMPVFHTGDTETLGPIRSGRPSDASLVRPLGATLVVSGGQPWVIAGINSLGVPLLGDTRPAMFRVGFRSAPHNLYASTIALREEADSRGYSDDAPPTSLWEFGEMVEGEEASHVAFTFSTTTTTEWTWDGETYWRTIDGVDSNWVQVTPPESEDGEATETTQRINADVLIAIVGRQYTASGSTGSSVPATDTTGSGPVHVFANGTVVSGMWERESAEDPFTFTMEDGETLFVPAGFPWISIVPDTGTIEFDNPPVTTTTTVPTDTTNPDDEG